MYVRDCKNSSRRYARLCHRVESGVLGRNPEEIRRVVLTTRKGDDNSWPTMCKHLKLLKNQLKYKSIDMEYIFAPHVSDESGLLHLDGLMWERSGSLMVSELQVMWNNIHGAIIVYYKEFKEPGKLGNLVRYIVSHMFKDYEKIIGFKGRVLVSRGWMPVGWQEVDKILTQHALESLAYLGDVAWIVKNDMYRRWLNGERLMFRHNGRFVTLKRTEVKK